MAMLVDIVDNAGDTLILMGTVLLLIRCTLHAEAGHQFRHQRIAQGLGAHRPAFVAVGIDLHELGNDPLELGQSGIGRIGDGIAVEIQIAAAHHPFIEQGQFDLYRRHDALIGVELVGRIGVDEDHVAGREFVDMSCDGDMHLARDHKEQLQAVMPVEPRISQLVNEELHRDAFAKVDDLMSVFHNGSPDRNDGFIFRCLHYSIYCKQKNRGLEHLCSNLTALLQHPLDIQPVPHRRVVDKHVGVSVIPKNPAAPTT